MSAVPGLGNANIRLVDPEPMPDDPAHVVVEMAGDGPDVPEFDDKGAILKIEHGDGSVTVSLDGKPIQRAANDSKSIPWFGNLAEEIDDSELNRIADDLLLGIDQDIESRREWIEDRAAGIELLGLKIQLPNVQGATEGAPVEGMSRVRHPLLLEAVLRFQANARSEMLPTDGPVKIRNDDNNAQLKEDQLANDYERDMNHYLTAVAKEYYPDTDRMLLMLGFGGTTFKKVYFCPLRNRPVSESVDADDIIVNQAAVNLAGARRVTHRTYLKPSTVKRLQILGVYRDIDLGTPMAAKTDAVQEAEKAQQGVAASNFRPDERDREIYECECELDISGFEHKWKGKESGLEIPYKVTIDVSTRQVLAITRNYEQKDQDLPTPRQNFIQYTFVPGFGFYGIGLLHILGNTTNAVTAAWREMLDNGMYACFPGFLYSKNGNRNNSNIFRVPPGGGAPIDTGGLPIGQAVMGLPYNSQGMPALMSLVENMVETGQRVGGTAELQVGEGRETAPVGTTMALIDQAIKIMNSVHKRMHASQAEEFQLLVRVFKEHPESFKGGHCKSKTKWDEQQFIEAVNKCELVPQADPNTASMGQRAMKIMGLKQLQQATPQLYDPIACDTAALRAMGYANPDEFFVPKQARSAPPPQLQQMQAQMANEAKETEAKTTEAEARATEAQAKAKEVDAKIAVGHYQPKTDAPGVAGTPPPEEESSLDVATAEAKLLDAHTKERQVAVQERQQEFENQNRDADRQADLQKTMIGLAEKVLMDPRDAPKAGAQANKIAKTVAKPKGKKK